MDNSPVAGVASLLLLLLLVIAPIAISRSPLKLKAALHILAGMAAGFATGIVVGRRQEAMNWRRILLFY
jgi:hypothetical protein